MSDGTVASGYPIARKPHRCLSCQRVIEKGERYYRWTGRGDWWIGLATWKECADCCERHGRPIPEAAA